MPGSETARALVGREVVQVRVSKPIPSGGVSNNNSCKESMNKTLICLQLQGSHLSASVSSTTLSKLFQGKAQFHSPSDLLG